MINLSLNELKLIVKYSDIKDYENKFEDNLIKTLREPKIKISIEKIRKNLMNQDIDFLSQK